MQNFFAQTCPILPNGAHLYTALVLFHRSSAQRCKSYSRQQLYGQRSSSRVNWLGIGADQISRSYFGGSVSAREVLVRHTVFGYYALGLSEQRASDWASSLALGQAQRATRYIRNATGAIVSGALRWCPVCAEEDAETHGFSSWKVVHQLPFVLQCPAHGCSLLSLCACCNQSLDNGTTLRLPGEACSRCGTTQFLSHAPPKVAAYSELLLRCAGAIETQVAIYRPTNWARLMRAFRSGVGSLEDARQLIQSRLLEAWGVRTIDAIGGSWLDGYRSEFLLQVVQGHLTVSPLAVQMLVLEVIQRDLPGICGQLESNTPMESVDSTEDHFRLFREPVCEQSLRAQQFGANERFAALFTEPHALAHVASELRISLSHAKMLVHRVRESVHGVAAVDLGQDELEGTELDKKRNRRREACRARVRKTLQAFPKASRTTMWKLCKNSVLWLIEHDKEWLDAHVPVRQRSLSA